MFSASSDFRIHPGAAIFPSGYAHRCRTPASDGIAPRDARSPVTAAGPSRTCTVFHSAEPVCRCGPGRNASLQDAGETTSFRKTAQGCRGSCRGSSPAILMLLLSQSTALVEVSKLPEAYSQAILV